MPLHIHCKKLQKRFHLRMHTLPNSHPMRAMFPHIFPCGKHTPHTCFTTEREKAMSSIPLTKVFTDGKPLTTDEYSPLHLECMLGDRVVDLYKDRITTHLEHPPKKEHKQLDEWICTDLQPRIQHMHDNLSAMVIFTDGSAIYNEHNGNLGRAAAYRAYHDRRLVRAHAIYTGYTFSYDCKLRALSMSIHYGYTKSGVHQLHLFSDNKSALQSICNTKGGLDTNIAACSTLRERFLGHSQNHLHLHYCLSHSGIAENEAVDHVVRHHVYHPDDLQHIGCLFLKSYLFVHSAITEHALAAWQEAADKRSSEYWRCKYFKHPAFCRLRHTGPFWSRRRGGPALGEDFCEAIGNARVIS
ncbi:hypothetical protein GY45DRAFT_1341329 [Cubamyces sp. BRFM 1775]|nr:hypothetical protein GY45DRAFT_1341329 [Cubamyces sp. BRFM 1775]